MKPYACAWLIVTLVGLAAAPKTWPAETRGVPSVEEPDTLDDRESTFDWSASYASRYSFQGFDYSASQPVFQGQLSRQFRWVELGVWGNFDQAGRMLNEVDMTIQSEWELGRMSVAVGYAYLAYPHRDWSPTHELYTNVAAGVPLQPSLGINWDVVAGAGRYWTLGLSHDLPYRGAAFQLGVKVYVHEHYYGMTGIPAFETSSGISVPCGVFLLRPSLSRQWTWENGDFRHDLAIRGGWVLSLTCTSP